MKLTELQLYKFINENNIEIYWHADKLIALMYFMLIEEFSNLIKNETPDAIKAYIADTYISVDLVPICEWHDIDPKNILKKEE